MKSLLLIDGDEYLFKASIAVQRVIKWDDQNHVVYANENEAFDNFARMVQQTQVRLDAEHSVICFGGERPYFREDLWPDYKSDRGTKPICYAAVRLMIQRSYQTKSYPHIEADDCLGILGTKPSGNMHPNYPGAFRSIMCSQDKDMLTVPGWHYDGKGDQAVWVSVEEARNNHYLQTLVGDRTDNYPGCPGLGPQRAETWLNTDDHMTPPWSWERVEAAFEKAKRPYDALLMARLARILQWSDWDYEKKEPILWTPQS